MDSSKSNTLRMTVQCIFSFDSKTQDIYDMSMNVPSDIKESDWIRGIIEHVYEDNMHDTKDLWKISMCISYDKSELEKVPMLKPMIENYLARNGKYFFRPLYTTNTISGTNRISGRRTSRRGSRYIFRPVFERRRCYESIIQEIICGSVIASETKEF